MWEKSKSKKEPIQSAGDLQINISDEERSQKLLFNIKG